MPNRVLGVALDAYYRFRTTRQLRSGMNGSPEGLPFGAGGWGRRESPRKVPRQSRRLCGLKQLHCFGVAHNVSQCVGPLRTGPHLADFVAHEPVA
jgi:hypothetical protein